MRFVDFPLIGTLIEKFPSKTPPTKRHVIQKICWEVRHSTTIGSFDSASIAVEAELLELCESIGYTNVDQYITYLLRNIKTLADDYKKFLRTPKARQTGKSFLKKKDKFVTALPQLFVIVLDSCKMVLTESVFSSYVRRSSRVILPISTRLVMEREEIRRKITTGCNDGLEINNIA